MKRIICQLVVFTRLLWCYNRIEYSQRLELIGVSFKINLAQHNNHCYYSYQYQTRCYTDCKQCCVKLFNSVLNYGFFRNPICFAVCISPHYSYLLAYLFAVSNCPCLIKVVIVKLTLNMPHNLFFRIIFRLYL